MLRNKKKVNKQAGGRLRKSIEEFMEDDKFSRLGAQKQKYIRKKKKTKPV